MPRNDEKNTKFSLASLIIPAIIGAITTIVAAYFSYSAGVNAIQIPINTTQTAEAKQTSVPSEPIVVTQIVEISSTPPAPTSNTVLFDDFTTLRNDGWGLQSNTNEKIATKVSGGHYIAEINTDNIIERFPINTENKIRNFDFVTKIAELQGDVYLSFLFRENTNAAGLRFDIFASGNRQGEYHFYNQNKEIAVDTVSFTKLSEVRIVCINDRCDIFLNGVHKSIKTLYPVFDPSGQFSLGLSGTGTIRIDEMTIQELQ